MRRNYVAWTSVRCHFGTKYPLGIYQRTYLIYYSVIHRCLFSICRLEDEEEKEKEENGEKEEKDTVYANINQLQKFARDITVPAVFKGKLIYGVHVVVSCLYFFGKMAKLKLLFNSFLLNVQ